MEDSSEEATEGSDCSEASFLFGESALDSSAVPFLFGDSALLGETENVGIWMVDFSVPFTSLGEAPCSTSVTTPMIN
jgi:hypothetical protein